MSASNPRKWFVSSFHNPVRISLRKVDRYAEMQRQFKPYFDEWRQAKAHMLETAEQRLTKAERELKSATEHLRKVTELQQPAQADPAPQGSQQAKGE